MEGLTEFYLTTFWAYKPKAVRQVLDDLMNLGYDEADFSYDGEYQWFKIRCCESDASGIRRAFALTTRNIEEEAFGTHEDSILCDDDTLKSSFDNEWFSQGLEGHSGLKDDDVEESHHHGTIAQYPYNSIWDDLDKHNEPYSVHDILTDQQLENLKAEAEVELSFHLAGKLVCISGGSEQMVRKTREKLKVMLAIKKLSEIPPMAEHLAYAEDYVEPGPDEFTADIRYLANIDPVLVSSTLLDRVTVESLAASYQMIYREGASLRLCFWVPEKSCRVSLLGPKVPFRHKDKSTLGNRPTIIQIDRGKVTFIAGEANDSVENPSPETENLDETWTEPEPLGSATDAAYTIPDGDNTETNFDEFTDEEVVDSDDEPSASNHRTPSATASGPIVKQADSISGVDEISNLDLSSSATHLTDVKASGDGAGLGEKEQDELAFTGTNCLVDMLAAVQTVTPSSDLSSCLKWTMAPLIPWPSENNGKEGSESDPKTFHSDKVSGAGGNENGTQTSGASYMSPHAQRFMEYLKSGAEDFKSMKSHDAAQQPEDPTIVGPSALSRPGVHPCPPSDLRSGGGLLATDSFIKETEAAIARLLSLGPYRRGKVAVRAEFGRAILEVTDPSGVAFNDETTPSNGWRKSDLLTNMRMGFGGNRNIHFTKILSTYASDIVDMINTKLDGAQLWSREPSRAWTTYSFYCIPRSRENSRRFIIDVEDDGSSGNVLRYSIRGDGDDPLSTEQPSLPVYIHAIRRHWDLSIVVSHVNTEELHEAYGIFANYLLQTLDTSLRSKGAPSVYYASHESFTAEVEEVRVLTKWRYPSLDRRSALEITEVEQMEIELPDYLENGWRAFLARPWNRREAKEMRCRGEFPRWYEAAVVSSEIEELCRLNMELGLGEKADWDPEDLRTRGVFSTLYGPALQMVREMDHVGRNDDNCQSQRYAHLLLRPN
ncbi:uncharacterized protein THITE_2036687, partial [Thermothielavioides terrestris NRRL 8126]